MDKILVFLEDETTHLEDDRVEEKYVRRGPSAHIKRRIRPVKILQTSKKGNTFYRTYYVGDKKHEKYSREFMRSVLSGERYPKYIAYNAKADAKMNQSEVPREFRDVLDKWSNTHVFASGMEQAYTDYRGHLIDTEGRRYIRNPENNSDRIVYSDGSFIESKMKMSRNDDGVDIQYNNRYRSSQGVESRSSILATAKAEGNRRILEIKSINNYHNEELGLFLTNMAKKFNTIKFSSQTRLTNPDTLFTLLQMGMKAGDRPSKFNKFKGFFTEGLESADGVSNGMKAKLKQTINQSRNMDDWFFRMVKSGMTGEVPTWVKSQVFAYLGTIGVSNFKMDLNKDRASTKSLTQLHSYMLQISPDNDYHKGYIQYKKERHA